jgi:ABC-type multidrug transport system permease subunit
MMPLDSAFDEITEDVFDTIPVSGWLAGDIAVSPARLGKTLPFALIGFVQVALVTTIGVFWFGVAIQGSLLLLAVSLMIYVLSALAIGLLISTVSRTPAAGRAVRRAAS